MERKKMSMLITVDDDARHAMDNAGNVLQAIRAYETAKRKISNFFN
jgi:hypothetical protein